MADRSPSRNQPPAPRGWGGVRVVGGRVLGVESNPELADERWPTVAREMMRTDDAVQALVEAVVGTLLSARWTATPGDPSSAFSRRLADDLAAMMGLAGAGPGMMARGWEEMIAESVLAELIGFRYAEPRWRYLPGFGVILDDLEDRDPTAHRRWIMERGRLVAVEQAPAMEDGAAGWGTSIRIPAGQLRLVVRGREGSGFIGRGLLRGCFALWRMKRHLLDMLGIAAERSAVGVPWLRHNWTEAREAEVSRPDFDDALETTRDALDDFVAQDRHWIESGPGVGVEMVGGDLDVGKAFIPGLEYCDRGIMRAGLVGFLGLGMSDASGSRALGEVVETFFRRSAAQALDRQAAAMNGDTGDDCVNGIVGTWVRFNHGPVDARLLPRLGHAGLTVHPLLDLADRLDLGQWLPTTPERRAILARELQLPPEPAPAADPPAGGQE